jgi:hypothetical protein
MIQATEKAYSPQKRTFSTSRHEISKFLLSLPKIKLVFFTDTDEPLFPEQELFPELLVLLLQLLDLLLVLDLGLHELLLGGFKLLGEHIVLLQFLLRGVVTKLYNSA